MGGAEARVRLLLVIAYDGGRFAGWQVQKSGRGVQACVEEALSKVFSGEYRLHSSSRTDAGVHARGMAAHVDLPVRLFRMTPSKLVLALNAHLAEDIRVQRARVVRPGFHARFSARGKEYRYFLWNASAMDPLLRHTAWHVPQTLDLEAMRRGCAVLVGKHDFRSFAATRSYEMESTERTVFRLGVRRQSALLVFSIEGDGFLYKMCRGIVGTLVQLGQGKFGEAELRRMLEARDRRMAGMSAPAHGLVLWRVIYGGPNAKRGPAGTGDST